MCPRALEFEDRKPALADVGLVSVRNLQNIGSDVLAVIRAVRAVMHHRSAVVRIFLPGPLKGGT